MEIKVSTNLLKQINQMKRFKEILNKAVSASMIQTGNAAVKDGKRRVIEQHFAPALKGTDLWVTKRNGKGASKQTRDRSLIKFSIDANPNMDWGLQQFEIVFSARSLRAKYFRPMDTVHSTAKGKRYGVAVIMGGKVVNTGGFHLRSVGKGKLQGVHDGKWGVNDHVFVRRDSDPKAKIRPYWFPSVADILRFDNGEEKWRMQAVEKFEGYFARNFKRYSYMVGREYKK